MRNLRFAALAAIVCAFTIPSLIAWGAGEFSTLPQVGQPSFSGGTSTGASGTVSTTTVPSGPSFLTGSEVVPADTNLTGGASPQTVTIPVPMLGNFWGTPRNYLGNGALDVTNTNGTSTVTCAANAAITVAAMSADRWGCQANVGSGAGRTAIVTSSPSPPTGFTNSMKVFRTSGALTQPICVWQAIPSPQSIQLQGQVVTFSFYAAALAGLAADNNNQMQAVVISGTGTDEALLSSPTASPAITPAWTGIATALNSTLTITTTFTRYAVQATIPAAATEVGVGLCFTPTATGAGATDGFAWTGAQLERSPGASAFEYKPKIFEFAQSQQYFYKVSETTGISGRAMCAVSTTSATKCHLKFPAQMYKIPTMSYTTGFASCTTTACTAVTACTSLATDAVATAVNIDGVLMVCGSSAAFAAAGSAGWFSDNSGSGVINAWTGF